MIVDDNSINLGARTHTFMQCLKSFKFILRFNTARMHHSQVSSIKTRLYQPSHDTLGTKDQSHA